MGVRAIPDLDVQSAGFLVVADSHAPPSLLRSITETTTASSAPKEHREQVTGDFAMEEYLELQRLVYRVSEGVREEGRKDLPGLAGKRATSENPLSPKLRECISKEGD
jgi:hypothetical protein